MAIQDGAKFASPLELIQYYTRKVDGLLTTLTTPCCRRPGQPPAGYRFITHEEMQTAMREAALLLGYQVHSGQREEKIIITVTENVYMCFSFYVHVCE